MTAAGAVEPLRPDTVVVIALGAAIGAEARYGLGVLWPHSPDAFPWATLTINISGSLLIGLLIAGLARHGRPHRLVRPLLATGVLGGYTTFSSFAVDVVRLGDAHRVAVAAAYIGLTVLGSALAVWAGERMLGVRPRELPLDPDVP